jgi:hypothetical protein
MDNNKAIPIPVDTKLNNKKLVTDTLATPHNEKIIDATTSP